MGGVGSSRERVDARRRSVSGLVGIASRAVSRAPASPPSASARCRCRSRSLPVRRLDCTITPNKRSANVRREQVRLRQRNRRAATRIVTGRPCQGRSCSTRRYTLWTRRDAAPQAGHSALVGRGDASMVTWFGIGSTRVTWSARGMKDSKGEGTMSTMNVSPSLSSISPSSTSTTGTQSAGEPNFGPVVLTDFGPPSAPQPRVSSALPGGSEWIGTPEWNCLSSSVGSTSLVLER